MSIEEDLDHVACPGSCSRRTFFSHGKRATLAGSIEAKTSPQKVAKGRRPSCQWEARRWFARNGQRAGSRRSGEVGVWWKLCAVCRRSMPRAMGTSATLQVVRHPRMPRIALNRFCRPVASHAHHLRDPPTGPWAHPALACRIKSVPSTPAFWDDKGLKPDHSSAARLYVHLQQCDLFDSFGLPSFTYSW